MKIPYEAPELKKIDVPVAVRDMLLHWDGNQLKTKFLTFKNVDQYPVKKTHEIEIYSKTDLFLATISWHDPWEKYVFVPRGDLKMIYDDQSLDDISNFCKMLMLLRNLEMKSTTS